MRVEPLILRWRKLSERRKLTEKQKATARLAHANLRELCAVAGPRRITEEYDAGKRTASEEEIAEALARTAYNPWAFEAAVLGALEGFAEFNRGG